MEILSPVGTIEALISAVNAGADAVYFGMGVLNARAKSQDFNENNIKKWVDYCHIFGVKVYITLNVCVFDNEFDEALRLARLAEKCKADALIVSDTGLILSLAKSDIRIPVHVSTQAGIKDSLGAEFFKKLNVTRVVFSREASLIDIVSVEGVEKEVFVHGALCVAFSGNCLLSSSIGGFSGNRGECRQPCRQNYTAYETDGKLLKSGYLLSAKDIALDDYVDSIKKANVDSLKIEGRLKSPEYVWAVTKYYKEKLSGLRPDKKDLLSAFNRGGFTPAYFKGKNVIYTKTASHIGVPVAKVIKNEFIKGYPFATIDAPIRKGDGIKFLRAQVEVGGCTATSCINVGNAYLIPSVENVCSGDTVCLTKSSELSDKISLKKKKISVNFHLELDGKDSFLKAYSNGCEVHLTLQEPSYDRTLTEDQVAFQLSKTGNTNFEAKKITFSGYGYYPKSFLNHARNEILEKLEKDIADKYIPQRVEKNLFFSGNRPFADTGSDNADRVTNGVDSKTFAIENYTEKIVGKVVESDKLDFVTQGVNAFVYYPKYANITEFEKAVAFAKEKSLKLFLKFPNLLSKADLIEIVSFAKNNSIGVYANNVSVVECARENKVPYIAGIELNIANKSSIEAFSDSALIIQSVETGLNLLTADTHIYTYGRVPLMFFEHCPRFVCTDLDCDKCMKKAQNLVYRHENDKYLLRGVRGKNRCYYTLYSGKKLNRAVHVENEYINLIDDNDLPVFDFYLR